ncbi:hypothetical protein L2E82_47714 [Cichorium intybus]|uniref:Uncharacterized protein n=1 Tax=Cichorium intybus TaxID=13427 RepID=A0ACB8YW37_CICIN|nr:hypothetical protein L2E82_47714 [Cichorium intybus]
MEARNSFILIFLIFTFMAVLDGKFTSNTCNHDQPEIHFPFKINSFCKNKQTMIKFPNYGDLGVKSISYDHKKLTLIDPKDCVFEVFLNLNLDRTPFRYYHVVRNYTFLNCSINLLGSYEEIPCLSGSKHHVYVVDSSLDVPSSCEPIKTVSIPFAYSNYVSDDSFGLDLTWDSTGFDDLVEAKRGWFGFQSIREAISIVILVLVVMVLACVKAYCWKTSERKKNEWDKLLGDLETL